MRTLVFLVEEPSAKALLEGLVPRLIPAGIDIHAQYLVFQGKQDLESKLVRRMRGWLAPNTSFVVLRDQDSADCKSGKKTLLGLVGDSGQPTSLVRVACRELESWIVGDWEAVAEAFGKPKLAELGTRKKFRDPDKLHKPSAELEKLVAGYTKTDGARRVGRLLHPERNKSGSFRAFCQGLKRVVGNVSDSI